MLYGIVGGVLYATTGGLVFEVYAGSSPASGAIDLSPDGGSGTSEEAKAGLALAVRQNNKNLTF